MADAVLKLLADDTFRFELPADDADIRPGHAPCAQTDMEQLLTAARIRHSIHEHKPVLLCAVCSCSVGRCDVHTEQLPLGELPHLELLAADGVPATPQLPRHGITSLFHEGRWYCLDADGATAHDGPQPTHVRVCKGCHTALSGNRVPPNSLVRVDTGPWPEDGQGRLPEVTVVEELLLSSVTPLRRIMIMRPASGRCDPLSCKKQLTGHVVVVPGPPVEQLAALLPRSFEDLAEFMTVSGG